MKRQSLVLLAVAFVAAGAAACFKDPVSGLRSGPAVLSTNEQAVILKTGDSTTVIAYLKDNAGNQLAVTGATWTSADSTIAVVVADTSKVIPGNAFARAFIRGVDSVSGGWTNVILTARGVVDTIRVLVFPAKLTAQHVATTGATLTDTVIVPANPIAVPPTLAKPITYTAKDTLILTGTSKLTFDTSQVTVSVSTTNGTSPGFIVAKTPSQLTVVFEIGTAGKVMVQHLLLTPGNASIGTVPVDTLISDSVAVAPWRIGQAAFGTSASVGSNVMTVTLPASMAFTAASSASFAGSPVAVIAKSAQSLSFFSTVPTTSAPVTVYNVTLAADPSVGGSITFDSLSSNVANYTLSPASLPNASVALSPNNSKLGDTIIITAPAGMTFSTTAPVSRVLVGNRAITTSDTAWNISLAAGTLMVLPKRGGSSNITVTNMKLPLAGAVPFALTTPATFAIDSVASDLPVGATKASAKVMTIPASNVDTVYGAVNATTITEDFWTFTTSAAHAINAVLGWYGSGNPYSTALNTPVYTNDLDLVVCNASMTCDENDATDLLGYAAATTAQPEHGTSASVAAGTYWAGIIPFTPDGSRTIVYRLIITLQ